MRAARRLGLGAVLAILLGWSAALPAGEAGRTEDMKPLLEHAIDHFELREYYSARAKLDALLSKDPTNEEAFRLREIVGEAILSRMATFRREGRDLGRAPVEILRRAQLHAQKLMLEPEHIEAVVQGALEGGARDIREVGQLGQYAVPELVEHLKSGVSQDQRVNAGFLLAQLGRDAVFPLLEALKTDDDLQRQGVVRALMDVEPPSRRVLAPVKQVYEEPGQSPMVHKWAGLVLKKVTGREPDALPSATEYLYMEADRYYLRGPGVDEETQRRDGVLWHWNEAEQKLTWEKVQEFAFPGVMCEKRSMEGMELAPEQVRFPVLLASLYFDQQARMEFFSQALSLRGVTRPDAEENLQYAKEWMEHTRKNDCIARVVGPRLLTQVLAKALADGKVETAVAAIHSLERTARWEDISAYDGAPPAAEEGAQAEEASARPAHPLRLALQFADQRVRVAAANCLVRIGYPTSAPDYPQLVPALVSGSLEEVSPVLLVISHDVDLRRRVEELLSKRGVQVLTAPSGRAGVDRAVRWPPKDAIFVDGDLEEFAHIQARLQMLPLVEGSPLPLTIITSPERVPLLRRQFPERRYVVQVIESPKFDDPERGIYDALARLRGGARRRTVALVSLEDRDDRERLKRILEEEAQSRVLALETGEITADMMLAAEEGLTSTYVNVFLADELSGYDAMRTVLDLRQYAPTRPVPVALITDEVSRKRVRQAFDEMLKDPQNARLVSEEEGADAWLSAVRDMTQVNPLSQENYTRQAAQEMALHASAGLRELDKQVAQGTITGRQIEALIEILRTRTEPADDPLRMRVARALGHFQAKDGLVQLSRIVRGQDSVDLRSACLRAIGAIDAAGQYHELKRTVLDESEHRAMQEAAAWALAAEELDVDRVAQDLRAVRVGTKQE